ncbi:MAG: nitrate reductase [Deltaproteobacteria bacterium]|nr:nitrate reductase [Deltaproteobacteria bacterium]
MYDFLIGPALWIAAVFFVVGLLIRMAFLFGLSRERDRVLYNHVSFGWAARSVIQWLIPLGSASLRQQPVFGLMVYLFHLALLATPIFLDAHNIFLDEAWGVRLWSMPDALADVLTIMVVGSGLFLFIRRLYRPEVRILTGLWDYTLLLLTLAPFVTGFLAYHQWGPYHLMMLLHILSGEILLILIPCSKLGHMILFFFTRAFIGFEMGGRRGARSW